MIDEDVETLREDCANISANIHMLFPDLNLYFLISDKTKRQDEASSMLSKTSDHPASNNSFKLIKPWITSQDKSSFLGLSYGRESIVFSFQTRLKVLSFIAIDTSYFSDYSEGMKDIYFQMSFFLETYSNLIKRPLLKEGIFFQQTPSEIAASRLNLKSDIFAVLQITKDGQYDSALRLARKYALLTLTAQSRFAPEQFPFPIAYDVVNYTLEKQINSTYVKNNSSPIILQYQLAEKITSCFEQKDIQSWSSFAYSSQIMAWSGFTPSQILGAAVHTSDSPFIKAIGHMVSEMTNIAPVEESHLPFGYNPFIAKEINEIRHTRAVEDNFEMILIHASEADSHLPLLRVANNQNEALLKGKSLGWCAHALHAASKAFIGAKERDIPAIQAARLEFQSVHLQSNWTVLRQVSHYVIEQQRNNNKFSMIDLAEWISQFPEAKFILDSLQITAPEIKKIEPSEAPLQAHKIELSQAPLAVKKDLKAYSPVLPHTTINNANKTAQAFMFETEN